jgi:hypothetical protein
MASCSACRQHIDTVSTQAVARRSLWHPVQSLHFGLFACSAVHTGR